MNAAARRRAVLALVILSAACGGSSPTSPAAPGDLPVVPAPPPPAPLPPITGPSRNFVFESQLSYPVSGYTQGSRYVLYDSGAFALQMAFGEYRGRYTEENGSIDFSWDGWSTAGRWGATGTIRDRLLTVQYNFIMQMTDFEDAVYMLVQ